MAWNVSAYIETIIDGVNLDKIAKNQITYQCEQN